MASRSHDNNKKSEKEELGFRNLYRFVCFTLPYWKWMLIGAVMAIFQMALPLAVPQFLEGALGQLRKYRLGEIQHDGLINNLWLMLWLFVALAAMNTVVTIGRTYFPQVAMSNAVRDIRYKMFSHLQRLSLGFHNQRPTGTIVSRVMSDVMVSQQIVEQALIVTLQQVVAAVVVIVELSRRDPVWALVSISTVPLFAIVTRLLRTRMRRASRQVQESTERMSGHVQERLAMIREIQAFTAEDYEQEAMLDEAEQLKIYSLKQRMIHGILSAASQLTRFSAFAVVIGFGSYRIINGHAEVEVLALFFIYTRRLMDPIMFFTGLYGQMHSASAAADRVFEFLDTEPKISDHEDALPISAPRPPTVRFENVIFSYPVDDPAIVINSISFEARAGSRVAIVGESGSGKTTLMSLLPRFYDIQEGSIFIGDQEIHDIKVQSLRESIAIVPQEPVLFSGTIMENIHYGNRDADEDKVVEAAVAANAHQFIESLLEGYDTLVGERGVGLSGGQIQRIAIARAFLKDPAILILDEATSNLDALSESLILDAIDRLAHGRTTFIIAHRLSTAHNSDSIIVIDDGTISERGTHDELLSFKGAYWRFWQRQMGDMT